MNQTISTDDETHRFTRVRSAASELSWKIQSDIAFLRDHLGSISEEVERDLVGDIERFFCDDIAKEIRLSLYDPLQNNRVFMEYCYKIDRFSSPGVHNDQETNPFTLSSLPETCLFDIFIFYTSSFNRLTPARQKQILKGYAIDWYDLTFNLQYSKKNKRKRTESVDTKGLPVNRYVYEWSENLQSSGDSSVETRSASSGVENPSHKQNSSFEKKLVEAVKRGEKLYYIVYKDLESTVESISLVLNHERKTLIRWSLSRGFTVDDLSVRHEVEGMAQLKNPSVALEFIIDNREDRVSYLFEDFHHHLGAAHSINTSVAEIRSLVRDVSRVLRGREECVFFLSPSDSLPMELAPVFNVIKQDVQKGTSYLEKYGYNMTDAVANSRIKPLVGRADKVKRVIQVLCQMETNNPLLVGGAGVGKTAIVEGIASEMIKGNVPPFLKGKTMFSLNLAAMVSGARYRGDFEERITHLIEEVQSYSRDLIIFIDEIHTLLGAGSAEGAAGAEDILKPALARGDFPLIGATTYEGYEWLMSDQALARRFQKVDIQPATSKEAEEILSGVLHIFEKHHGITIAGDAVAAAVGLSEQYIQDQFLPGKAIRLLDSASAFVKLEGGHSVCRADIEDEVKRGEG